MRKLVFLATFGLACFIAVEALADGMRCGDTLVADGGSAGEVLLKCGEPFYRETVAYKGVEGSRTERTVNSSTEVQVEKWYYEFGKDMFIRILTFEQGTLVRVEEWDKP